MEFLFLGLGMDTFWNCTFSSVVNCCATTSARSVSILNGWWGGGGGGLEKKGVFVCGGVRLPFFF